MQHPFDGNEQDQKRLLILLREQIEKHGVVLDYIANYIVLQQKDACELADITPETMRRKVLEGHVTPLARDGSTLKFFTLKQMLELKPNLRKKRKIRANKKDRN